MKILDDYVQKLRFWKIKYKIRFFAWVFGSIWRLSFWCQAFQRKSFWKTFLRTEGFSKILFKNHQSLKRMLYRLKYVNLIFVKAFLRIFHAFGEDEKKRRSIELPVCSNYQKSALQFLANFLMYQKRDFLCFSQ